MLSLQAWNEARVHEISRGISSFYWSRCPCHTGPRNTYRQILVAGLSFRKLRDIAQQEVSVCRAPGMREQRAPCKFFFEPPRCPSPFHASSYLRHSLFALSRSSNEDERMAAIRRWRTEPSLGFSFGTTSTSTLSSRLKYHAAARPCRERDTATACFVHFSRIFRRTSPGAAFARYSRDSVPCRLRFLNSILVYVQFTFARLPGYQNGRQSNSIKLSARN